jgi:hypothetical protein
MALMTAAMQRYFNYGWSEAGRFADLKMGDRLQNLDTNGLLQGQWPTTDFYVDASVSASGDGLSFATAFKTINEAMAAITALGALRGRSRVLVAPGGYNEDVVTPLNSIAPFGQLIGVSPTTLSFGGAYIYAATGATPSLTVKARGWLIAGFEFGCSTGGGAILLDGLSANSNAGGVEIAGCNIAGWGGGLYGIDVKGNGAPLANIHHNIFTGIVAGAGTRGAIICSDSGTDQPRFWDLHHNRFVDNTNHVTFSSVRGCKESDIHDNSFIKLGGTITATRQLDTTGGRNNNVYDNMLSSTYDNAGGYYSVASDYWYGNRSEDGFTTARPVA